MRIIFSRKGFDSGSGGAPSPIIGGSPVSLPIPAYQRSVTRFDDLGLGKIVEEVTRGKIARQHLCHEDPLFGNGECYFGQSGAAQTHLRNHGVRIGDVFLFFGLFRDEGTGEKHHRIFGFLEISEIISLGKECVQADAFPQIPRRHPHLMGSSFDNNTIYRGSGKTARRSPATLRLTQTGGPASKWDVPDWLQDCGLSCHDMPWRWFAEGKLQSVARGQEFVTDIGEAAGPKRWLRTIIDEIGR